MCQKTAFLDFVPFFLLGINEFLGTFQKFLGTDDLVLSRLAAVCSHVPMFPAPKLEREKEGGYTHSKIRELFLSFRSISVFIFRVSGGVKKANKANVTAYIDRLKIRRF